MQHNQDLKLTNQIKNHHKQQFQFKENKFKAKYPNLNQFMKVKPLRQVNKPNHTHDDKAITKFKISKTH